MRKTKTFQIHIPEPCNEKWADMTPTKGGRHCERCEKTIVDFTNKTDREIAYLYKEENGKFCGRFAPDQLQRDILLHPKSPSRNTSKVAAALLAGMLSAGTAVAQGEVVVQRTEQHVSEKENQTTPSCNRVISGQVRDESGLPLPFANVFIKGTHIGTTTNIDGYYSLQVPEGTTVLVVAYFGYKDMEVDITDTQNIEVNVVIEEYESLILGDICVVEHNDGVQDAPRGRTFPRLIGDWIQNIKEKRSNRKPKPQPEILPSPTENAQVVEPATSDTRPPQVVTEKLIVKVAPNPFDDNIRITLQSEKVETLRFVLYDSMSREIHSEEIDVFIGTNEINMDLTGKQLVNGSYFLSVFRGEEIFQTKIMMRAK